MTRRVPYVDFPRAHAAIRDELLAAVARVLEHGQFILGPEVNELERRLASLLGAPFVVSVGNGTDALVLALRLHGIGPGDEVITVSHSFVATASAIALVGATPVFVDVHPDTTTMDPSLLRGALTPRTRAVMPVHLGGIPCDMEPIIAFSDEHGLALVEDAAQSIAARLGGRAVGTFGTGCFSLHPLKVLGAIGDAGFLALRSEDDAARARVLRNIGLVDRDRCVEVSGNTRLDTIQAAMLLVKLDRLDAMIAARRAHAARYRAALGGAYRLTHEPDGAFSVFSTFVVRHPRRDELLARARALGIDLKIHYPTPIHRQAAFASHGSATLPVTDAVVRESVSLPVTPELSEDDRALVIDLLLGHARSAA